MKSVYQKQEEVKIGSQENIVILLGNSSFLEYIIDFFFFYEKQFVKVLSVCYERRNEPSGSIHESNEFRDE